jgi:DNA-binding CsgD family transcriptional regulator
LNLHDEDASPAIAQAAAADPTPVVAVVTGHLDAALSLKFARLGALYFPKPFEMDHATALLRLVETRRDGGLSLFVRRYGLSPREREAVKNALQRKSLRTAAAQMRISATTLREYWTRIFEKTGVRSQRDVIETVASIAKGEQPAHDDRSLAASTAKMPEKR